VLERKDGYLNTFCEALQIRQMVYHKRNITFEPCAGDVQLNVDWHLINVAVSNLIGNAIKYAPPDSEIGLRVALGRGESVSIEVHDQGEAILPSYRRRFSKNSYAAVREGA